MIASDDLRRLGVVEGIDIRLRRLRLKIPVRIVLGGSWPVHTVELTNVDALTASKTRQSA